MKSLVEWNFRAKVTFIAAFLLGVTLLLPFLFLAYWILPYDLVFKSSGVWGFVERYPSEGLINSSWTGIGALVLFYGLYLALVVLVWAVGRDVLAKPRHLGWFVEYLKERFVGQEPYLLMAMGGLCAVIGFWGARGWSMLFLGLAFIFILLGVGWATCQVINQSYVAWKKKTKKEE